MTITPTKPNWMLALGFPLLVYMACYVITFTSVYRNNPLISLAVTGDLVLTAPFLYFLAIRKSTVSNVTVLRVMLVSLLVAGLVIDPQANPVVHTIKMWLPPVIEGSLIFVVARKFYAANKHAQLQEGGSVDFLLHCRKVLQAVTGSAKAGNLLAAEIAVFYYALMGKKEKSTDGKSRFTSYRKNGIILVLSTFLFLFLIETTGVHFLLTLWNKTAAWVLTALSFYTCIQLYAHIRAIRIRTIQLTGNSLKLHMGLAADASVKLQNIAGLELAAKRGSVAGAVKIALVNGLENHNCILHLKEPVAVIKMFGIKKQTRTLLFFVDQPQEFIAAVRAKLPACTAQ